tara:strand:+ start:343 stop:567 length:225 start_codon:yes stop_codon:yes gene_type:complete
VKFFRVISLEWQGVFLNEQFGHETQGTLFHTKKQEKRYHIDYLFLRQTGNVIIGSYEDWINFSDHVPIIVDLQS